VAKLNATGSGLVYSSYLGAATATSDGYRHGRVGQRLRDGRHPIDRLSDRQPHSVARGRRDPFVAKVNAAGSALVYSTYLGGSDEDVGEGIAVDTDGNAYVTGGTLSTDLPTANAFQPLYGGGFGDVFVTKLNTTGSALVYSTYLGGSGDDAGFAIALDTSRNAYVTGFVQSTDFPTAGAFDTTLGGGSDAFVAKLNAAGSALVYSTYLGGGDNDYGYAIAIGRSGSAYVTGDASSTDFPTINALQPAFGGLVDAFAAKVNPSGSALVYSTYLGGGDYDNGRGIAVGASGNAYVVGNVVDGLFDGEPLPSRERRGNRRRLRDEARPAAPGRLQRRPRGRHPLAEHVDGGQPRLVHERDNPRQRGLPDRCRRPELADRGHGRSQR
jgi:hypothetical protein